MDNRLKPDPLPGTDWEVLTERMRGYDLISLVKARILLRISVLASADKVNTCSLLNPRSLFRRYCSWLYTTQVQNSMIIEIENCTTTRIRRNTTLLDPFERLPFNMVNGLKPDRYNAG